MFKKLKDEVPQTEINTSEPLDFQIEELMIHIPGLHDWKGKLTTVEVTMPVVGMESYILLQEHPRNGAGSGERIVNMDYEGTYRKDPIEVVCLTPSNFCEDEKERNNAPTTFQVDINAGLSDKYGEHLPRGCSMRSLLSPLFTP